MNPHIPTNDSHPPEALLTADDVEWRQSKMELHRMCDVGSLKEMSVHLMMGRNFRIDTEIDCRKTLWSHYSWISRVKKNAQTLFGEKWRESLLKDLSRKRATQQEKKLRFWLLGLTEKTAKNVDVTTNLMPLFLDEQIQACHSLFNELPAGSDEDEAWLLMMAGAATLTLRGSNKSYLGKAIEKAFLIAAYSVMGLELNVDFRVCVDGDNEIARQVDAEIFGVRARYFIELGLIAEGNPEVIFDKVSRLSMLGTNHVVIYDKLSHGSSESLRTLAGNRVVCIPIRNSQPLTAMRQHLSTVLGPDAISKVVNSPKLEAERDIREAVFALPDSLFLPALQSLHVCETTTKTA